MKGVYIIMSNIADKFEELGVIPVVVLNDAKDALPLAKALVDGGLPCAEVTFRTAAAEPCIRLHLPYQTIRHGQDFAPATFLVYD